MKLGKFFIFIVLICFSSLHTVRLIDTYDNCEKNVHYKYKVVFSASEQGYYCSLVGFNCLEVVNSTPVASGVEYSCCCRIKDKAEIIKVAKAAWENQGQEVKNKNSSTEIWLDNLKRFDIECKEGGHVEFYNSKVDSYKKIVDSLVCKHACWNFDIFNNEQIFCIDTHKFITKEIIPKTNCYLDNPTLGYWKLYFSDMKNPYNEREYYFEVYSGEVDKVKILMNQKSSLCKNKLSTLPSKRRFYRRRR